MQFQDNGTFYQLTDDHEKIHLAHRLRHDVYLKLEYIDSPYEGGIIADPKNEVSHYFLATDQEGLAGTSRLTPIEHSHAIFNLWKDHMISDECCRIAEEILGSQSVELGAMVTREGSYKSKVSWGLYRLMYQFSLEQNTEYWVIAVDAVVRRTVSMAGWWVMDLGKKIHYMGSPSVLSCIRIPDQADKVRQRNRTFYEFITTR